MHKNVNDDLKDIISLDFTVSLPTQLKTVCQKQTFTAQKCIILVCSFQSFKNLQKAELTAHFTRGKQFKKKEKKKF